METILKETDRAGWIERRAKLFEAGEYPDKGLTITTENLQEIENAFDEPVPVLIEHSTSPLEIGYLTGIEARGDELYGVVALTPEADALIERSGARSLSLGLAPDLKSIREVSIVAHPRVADARLFAGLVRFDGRWSDALDEGAEAFLRRALETGRLVPAQSAIARALLGCRQTVAFGRGTVPVARLAQELIERQAPHSLNAELGRQPSTDHSEHLMLPEEVEFYRRHFPDIDLDAIAQRKGGRPSNPRR